MKIYLIFFSLIVLGILVGLITGVVSLNPNVEEMNALRIENQDLQYERYRSQVILSGWQAQRDWLRAIANGTDWLPPPGIVEQITAEKFLFLIGADESLSSVHYDGFYDVTTREELERFLSVIVQDPAYQKLSSASKPFSEFTNLVRWKTGLAIGFVLPYYGIKKDFYVVVIVKEKNGDYGIYRINGGRLDPFDKAKLSGEIYLPS